MSSENFFCKQPLPLSGVPALGQSSNLGSVTSQNVSLCDVAWNGQGLAFGAVAALDLTVFRVS